MEGIFGLLAFGTIGSFVYLLVSLRFRQRARAWQDAARAAGVTDVKMTSVLGWETKLNGHAGPLRVRIESYQRGKYDRGTRVVVGGLRHGAFGLTVRAEGVTARIEKAFGEREIELGDEAFDGAAYLQGSPALVRALFDADTRRLTADLLDGHLRVGDTLEQSRLGVRTSISDSELRVEIRERPFSGVEQRLPDVLRALLDVGRRLLRPEDLASKIAANTRVEPVDAVRIANLMILAREFPAHAATRETLVAALDDYSFEVRVRAAIALGPEGRDVLLAILRRDNVPDEVGARAIVGLGADFAAGDAVAVLRAAVTGGRRAMALRSIGALGQTATDEGTETLARVVATEDAELAVAAARALGATGAGEAEPALIGALGHDAPDVRVAAAEALGRVGSPRAVVPLKTCAASHTFDGMLKRAVRQAVAEIQARVPGASPGQLSMAATAAGQVSLVEEDRRGQVSLEGATPPDATSDPDGNQSRQH